MVEITIDISENLLKELEIIKEALHTNYDGVIDFIMNEHLFIQNGAPSII